MHNRIPEFSILLAGEEGFVFRNLQWHFGDSKSISLLASEPDPVAGITRYPEFIVYIYSDSDALDSKHSCSKPKKSKLEEISAYSKHGSKLIVLGVGEDELAIVDKTNIIPVPLSMIFGKWAKPCSESPIAMACKQVIDGKENDLEQTGSLELLYIDDLAYSLLSYLGQEAPASFQPGPVQSITCADLKSLLVSFRQSRQSLLIPEVGNGLVHALYATYISYLNKDAFSYPLENHADERGSFIEMLKTVNSGQISCLTAGPGVTRGQHYHHSKSEKFLVVKGKARFCFRNLLSNETHEIIVSGDSPQIVETIPGWVHNITNISDEEMIVILWANELFNPEHPDTIPGEI